MFNDAVGTQHFRDGVLRLSCDCLAPWLVSRHQRRRPSSKESGPSDDKVTAERAFAVPVLLPRSFGVFLWHAHSVTSAWSIHSRIRSAVSTTAPPPMPRPCRTSAAAI